MKSWLIHYTNKYPGGTVEVHQREILVYCAAGKKRVQLWKNGADMWVDVSAENLCVDRHDLAPIPKETRAFKLYADGRVGPGEEYQDRIKIAEALARHPVGGPGKVPSIDEIMKSKAVKETPSVAQVMLEEPKVKPIEAEYQVLKDMLEESVAVNR